MPKKWEEVKQSEQFQSLAPEEQEAARQQYFDDVVAPNVPAEETEAAREQFDSVTKFDVTPKQGTQRNPSEARAYEPSVFERVGDFFTDVLSTMQHEGSTTINAGTALLRSKQATPVYDETGELQDVRYETDEERNKRIKNQRIISREVMDVPEEGSAAYVTGRIAAEIIDPIGYLSGFAAANVAKTSARMLRLAAAGTAYEATSATVEQLAQEGEVTDVKEIAGRAVAGGVAMPVADLALRQMAKMVKKYGAKKAEKMVDKIQLDVDEGMKQGLNPQAAFRRSLQARGIDEQIYTEVIDKAGKKVKIKYRAPDVEGTDTEVAKDLNKFSSMYINAKKAGEATGEKIDEYIGVLSTRVNKKSPKLAGALRWFEYSTKQRVYQGEQIAHQFNQAFRKLSKKDQREFKRYVLNGDKSNVQAFIARSGNTELSEGYQKIRPMLDDMYSELEEAGHQVGYADEYFPRVIKDYKSFIKKLGGKNRSEAQKAIEEAEIAKGAPLTDVEATEAINKSLRRNSAVYGTGGTSALKERKIEKVTDQILDEYADLPEALNTYINTMSHKLEARKFFAHGLPEGAELPSVNSSVDQQLRALLGREASKGNITWDDEQDLYKLLFSRFGPGEVAAPRRYQLAKNVFYAATIGNIRSTITQAGDVSIAASQHGVARTTKVLGDILLDAIPKVTKNPRNRIQIRPQDIGIDQVTQEFESTLKSARALNKIFKATGFRKMDQIGKTSVMNSSLRKMQKQSLSDKGIQKLKNKYADSFTPDEMVQAIDDLKNKRMTDRTKFMVFSELSDVQPITLSEMPQKYLDHPKGRIFYMLKSFTVKQLDIMRRTGFQEIKKGNRAKGAQQLMKFGMLLTAANMGTDSVKDWMLGRETEMEDKVVSNLYKNFGVSDYTVRKALGAAAEPVQAAVDLVLPPLSVAEAFVVDMINLGKALRSGDTEDITVESSRYLPYTGPMTSVMYNYFTEGDWEEPQK